MGRSLRLWLGLKLHEVMSVGVCAVLWKRGWHSKGVRILLARGSHACCKPLVCFEADDCLLNLLAQRRLTAKASANCCRRNGCVVFFFVISGVWGMIVGIE